MKRPQIRPVAERLIVILKEAGAPLTSGELAELSGVGRNNLRDALGPEIAAGQIAVSRVLAHSGQRVVAFEWLGERAPGFDAEPATAASLRAAARRPCLCCGQPFVSEGPHNRLCVKCRARDVSPYAP
ncbi:MAG: hypothetical protein FWC58_11535 [Desulfobulbus sp.]|nr:hypothetical protein [Desulfobulbus sp.]